MEASARDDFQHKLSSLIGGKDLVEGSLTQNTVLTFRDLIRRSGLELECPLQFLVSY